LSIEDDITSPGTKGILLERTTHSMMPWSPLSSGTKIHTETRIASVATAQREFNRFHPRLIYGQASAAFFGIRPAPGRLVKRRFCVPVRSSRLRIYQQLVSQFGIQYFVSSFSTN
jgi:hypothetical protein